MRGSPKFAYRLVELLDEVLGWISTQETQTIDKADLYCHVLKLRPASLRRRIASGTET
jgi:hypothetical protein